MPSQLPRARTTTRTLVLSGVAVLALAVPTTAQDDSPAAAESPAAAAESAAAPAASGAVVATEQVDLPAGWQPEGIASMGGQMYVGSLADGAIYRIDAATREGDVFVPGVEGAVAVGVEADEPNGRIWVAGGPTKEVRAYAADTGELLETFTFDGAGFLNDLAFTGNAVIATDSNIPQIMVIPLGADGSLPTRRAAGSIPLLNADGTGPFEYVEDAFNANGIVANEDGSVLFAVLSETGDLIQVDPQGGYTTAIDTGGTDLTFGDGLELDGSTLFVSRNQANTITTLELAEDLLSASVVAETTPEGVDIPSTVALADGDLWIVNARFGTDATPETPYWVSIWPDAQRPAA